MNIKKIAQEAIIETGILPAEDIVPDGFINPDWDGKARILIVSPPTEAEDAVQFGVLSAVTHLEIHTIAQTEQDAAGIERQAVSAAYHRLEAMEQERNSGILCVTYVNHNTFQMKERSEYQSMFTLRVLHKLNH